MCMVIGIWYCWLSLIIFVNIFGELVFGVCGVSIGVINGWFCYLWIKVFV